MKKIGNNRSKVRKNMRTKKGFTLIELLAVIVILAVIALIATPLVMSTINDAKEGTLKSTVRAIKKEAETLYVQKVQANSNEIPNITINEIEYSGEKIPEEDIAITFDTTGVASIAVYRDSKCFYKLSSEGDVQVEKTWTKDQCLQSVLSAAELLIKKANSSEITDYNNGNKGEMYTFSHTIDEITTTDYRYIGSAPNNYIKFNGEEDWRIIGVFGDNIKIIREDSIGWMSRDYKKGSADSPLGSSVDQYGSNDWTDSQLMYALNPTTYELKEGYTLDGNHIRDVNGNIIYQLGTIPAPIEVGATSTTYQPSTLNWKLSEEALALVETTTYNLGAIVYNGTTHYGGAESMHAEERGTTTWNNQRPTSWTGKVGLMYPSDYAYTFAYQNDAAIKACYEDTYTCRTDATYSNNPNASWLYKNNIHQWTISPRAGNSASAFFVITSGYVNDIGSHSTRGVRPVVYLKSDIHLMGTGASDSPYQIAA